MIISGPSQTSSTQWPKIKQHKNKINRNPNPESRRRKENESLLVSPAPPSSHQKPSPLLACFAAGLPLQLNKTEYNNHRNGSWEHPMCCLLLVVMVRRWRVICRVTSGVWLAITWIAGRGVALRWGTRRRDMKSCGTTMGMECDGTSGLAQPID